MANAGSFFEAQNDAARDPENLSFLGRDANSMGTGLSELPKYKAENFEMYGPLWIFVTLVVEFVILGHLTN